VPHMVHQRKFGRQTGHRKAMLRNLTLSVLRYESVKTTEAKAKEVRKFIDGMIVLGKDGSLVARRKAIGWLPEQEIVEKLFTDLASRYADRPAGFQVQDGARTVQGELEAALATVCDEPVRIAGAGRTDAGVHAIGQVISFRTASALDGSKLGRGVNALLPDDVAISALETCGDEFHARFSATGRTYEYRLRIGPDRDPLERWAYHHPAALRLDALREASAALVGLADFGSFANGESAESQSGRLLQRGMVRTVRRAEWTREGELLRFEIEADAFLRGMVRAVVGTRLWVGRGKIGIERFGQIIGSSDRAQAGPSAPARGLRLTRVGDGQGGRRGERASESS